MQFVGKSPQLAGFVADNPAAFSLLYPRSPLLRNLLLCMISLVLVWWCLIVKLVEVTYSQVLQILNYCRKFWVQSCRQECSSVPGSPCSL